MKQRPTVLMPHDVLTNLFILELAAAYQAIGYDVVLGRENLTYLSCAPQILHLHWPEEHFASAVDSKTPAERAKRLIQRVDELKSAGSIIVWQVHNLHPHESESSSLEASTYQDLLDRADLVIHHCETSVKLVGERYSVPESAKFVVTPHGNYLAYPNLSNRASAREYLGLDKDRFVFLHFGAVRAYKGLDLLLRAFSMAKVPKKQLLIAGRYAAMKQRTTLLDRLKLRYLRQVSRRIRLDLRTIPDEEIHYFFNAADVVVLSHRWGLNSGVAVVGMGFGKVVVGPDCGCIGEVLRAGDNVTYEPGNVAALAAAMEATANMDLESAKARNHSRVGQWRWSQTVEAVDQFVRGASQRIGARG